MSIANGRKSEFKRAIMEKGFYPENLPPVFCVRNFYRAASNAHLFNEDQIQRNKPLALSRYNETKRGGQRRVFSTPNPLFFIDAGVFLADHRRRLSRKLSCSRFSRSIPEFDPEFERAVRIDSFPEFTASRRAALSAARYIVKLDISRFFHSIYTHSISWAVHGKLQAKQDRSVRSTATYANKLDYLIRQSQDQQTIGIPVGPDTSRIVSELIATAIDHEFERQVGSNVIGVRLVDDVYIGASTIEEAEAYLSAYRNAIREFELDVNENKTRIFESRQDLEYFWPVAIRREIEAFSDGRAHQAADLVSYLDEIIRMANRENDDGILKYAIRRMDEFHLWTTYWQILEPFLIRVAVNFPHCLSYIAEIVVWRHRRFRIDNARWESVCRSTIRYHAPLGNDSEVVWACWILKEIGERLPAALTEPIIERCGPFAVLLAIDLASNGAISGRFPRQLVYERLGNHPMLGNDWLLSYEAERSFGFRLNRKNRVDYSVFGDLIQRDAQFYDSDALPFVFQGVNDIDDVEGALEDRTGLYENEDVDEDDVLAF